MQEQFTVTNVKCNGCVENIRKGLLKLPGVTDVEVAIENGQVVVDCAEKISRAQIGEQLAQLGYPEE